MGGAVNFLYHIKYNFIVKIRPIISLIVRVANKKHNFFRHILVFKVQFNYGI